MRNAVHWIIGAAFVVAVVPALAGPAVAQVPGSNSGGGSGGGVPMPGFEIGGPTPVDPETAEKRKEIEKRYNEATRGAPAPVKPAEDPWANMRGPNESKAKPAAKGTAKTTKQAGQNAQKNNSIFRQ